MKSCRSQKALKSYHRLLIGPYCDSSIGNMKKACFVLYVLDVNAKKELPES